MSDSAERRGPASSLLVAPARSIWDSPAWPRARSQWRAVDTGDVSAFPRTGSRCGRCSAHLPRVLHRPRRTPAPLGLAGRLCALFVAGRRLGHRHAARGSSASAASACAPPRRAAMAQALAEQEARAFAREAAPEQSPKGRAAQQADQAGSPKRRGKTRPRRSQLIRGALDTQVWRGVSASAVGRSTVAHRRGAVLPGLLVARRRQRPQRSAFALPHGRRFRHPACRGAGAARPPLPLLGDDHGGVVGRVAALTRRSRCSGPSDVPMRRSASDPVLARALYRAAILNGGFTGGDGVTKYRWAGRLLARG